MRKSVVLGSLAVLAIVAFVAVHPRHNAQVASASNVSAPVEMSAPTNQLSPQLAVAADTNTTKKVSVEYQFRPTIKN